MPSSRPVLLVLQALIQGKVDPAQRELHMGLLGMGDRVTHSIGARMWGSLLPVGPRGEKGQVYFSVIFRGHIQAIVLALPLRNYS